jgi:DNA-binding beta-propeller fold protein YncE
MIYVADTGNHRIKIFNTDGTLAGSWGSNGKGPGQFAGHHSGPRGIAIDARDHVYVVDAGGGRVQKFTAQGDFITAWGEPGTAPGQFTADDLRGPQGIALDGAGNVYVADTAAGRIQKFTGDGALLAVWTTALQGETRASPTWLAISSDRLYVTDRVGQRVQYYDLAGTAIGVWSGTKFKNIGGIAVSPTGAVYVADKENLSIFTPDGVTLRRIRPYNDGRAHPAAVALGLAGQVYVIDRTGNYISVLSSER